jgi:hypothetical protein
MLIAQIKKHLLAVFLSLSFALLTSLDVKAQQANDLTIVLHENTINKLFTALGTMKGSSEYKVGFISGKYDWTLIRPRIELIKDSGRFVAEVNVKAGIIDYTTEVPGKVHVYYDEKKNLINVKITDAVFEIYTRFLGKKIHLKTIQLADYFTSPFSFEGPLSMESAMDFEMPDGTKKILYARPTQCKLKIEPKQIIVLSQIGFFDKTSAKP